MWRLLRSWPWFETRGYAALLTMTVVISDPSRPGRG